MRDASASVVSTAIELAGCINRDAIVQIIQAIEGFFERGGASTVLDLKEIAILNDECREEFATQTIHARLAGRQAQVMPHDANMANELGELSGASDWLLSPRVSDPIGPRTALHADVPSTA